MLCILLVCAALFVVGMLLLVHASFFAPFGVEDETSFRITEPTKAQIEAEETLLSTAELSFFTR